MNHVEDVVCCCSPNLSGSHCSVFAPAGLRVEDMEDETWEGLQELGAGRGQEEGLGGQLSRHPRAQQWKPHLSTWTQYVC